MHYCGDDIGKFDDVLAIIRGATEPDADFGLADTAASSFILVLDRLLEKFEGPTTSLHGSPFNSISCPSTSGQLGQGVL
jgi:hypothetical protein